MTTLPSFRLCAPLTFERAGRLTVTRARSSERHLISHDFRRARDYDAGHEEAIIIVGFEPIFTVADVGRAVDHYQRLGFATSHHDETYAFAHRDGLTIHLAHRDDPAAEGPSALYLHVEDAEELAAQWRRAGVQVAGPEDFDYGKREGWHLDPDGNKIRFGSPLPRRPVRG